MNTLNLDVTDAAIQWSIGFCLTHWSVYVLYNTFLLLCLRYNWFPQYKIQPDVWPAKHLIQEAFRFFVIQDVLLAPLAFYAMYKYTPIGRSMLNSEWPSLWELVSKLVLWHLIFDTYFYWTHRLAHHKSIYKYVHKKHHRFTAPIGISAQYSHPIEHVFINVASAFLGPILFPSNLAVVLVYHAMRMHETSDAHSGYAFPWSLWSYTGIHAGPRWHDFHHSNQVGNFGGFRFWDTVMGTDQATLEKKRQGNAKKTT